MVFSSRSYIYCEPGLLPSIFCINHARLSDNEEWEGTNDSKEGPTHGVGVTALLFGILHFITVLVLFRQSGDGPLLPCAMGLCRSGSRGHPQITNSVSQGPPVAA